MPKIKDRYTIRVGKDFERYHMALDIDSALEKTQSRTFGDTDYVNSGDGTLVVAGVTGNVTATLPRRTK